MRHHIFEPAESYSIAVLIKGTSFNKQEILKNYLDPLAQMGVPIQESIAFTVEYNTDGKAPVKFIKNYLDTLLPVLEELKIKYLYVADSAYFKALAGQSKAEPHHGYVLPCKIKGYEHMKVVLGLNYQTLIYNPALQTKLDNSLHALASALVGAYQAPGTGIIHSAAYPSRVSEIEAALQSLHQYPELTADIEAFSLKFNKAGIGTIAFAWDEHNGIAFACDYSDNFLIDNNGHAGANIPNKEVRKLLLDFLLSYKGKLTWHNSTYDIKVIIFTLWMKDLLDTKGLLSGLEIMTRAFDDTKIIAYLATNSTAGNDLKLKSLAQEFAGSWAKEDIKDIRKIPLPELLQYNLVDALSTWYVKDKLTPIMRRDNQEDLYEGLFKDSLKTIIQMELTGMPLSAQRVQEVKFLLTKIQDEHLDVIQNSGVIKLLELILQTSKMEKENAKLKVKQHPLEKFKDLAFNPNSPLQLQRLLYEQMCLPVLDKTDTGQPATGAETLEKLIHHTEVPAYKELLAALIGHGKVSIILNTFIPAFERAILKGDGDILWLHGNFNLGGTVSGRLSSSDPNLTNIPAGSTYGKLIKECFVAPPGWIMLGADFSSLEDYISALTTKDRNKLRVYEDLYDGHCLRAFSYYREQMPDIVDTVQSINSIKKKYPHLRQASKTVTFALTYGGTAHTLNTNSGIPVDEAKQIEARYHELYKESDEYIQTRLQQASVDGYVEVAFGLRVRTPLLAQVVFGSSRIPYEAAAEGRTAGNAMGQSYCLLNNRSANEFMQKVWASPYRLNVLPIAQIHDAQYYLVRDDLEIVEWVNRELIKSMEWQELPEIQHPTVRLNAELDVFYKGWHQPITLPNRINKEEILRIAKEGAKRYDIVP